jgi:type II secretory pathway pseudopilin PulG
MVTMGRMVHIDRAHMAGRRRRAAGFTYIGVLLLVAMMGVSLSVVGEVWQTKQKREKEAELLYVGDRIRHAIGLYNANTPGGAERFPRRLEDLLKDPRYPGVRRYLRKIYRDPMTGRAEWGLVKAGDYLAGVYSLSEDEPLKKSGFRGPDRSFEGMTKYRDWVFVSGSGPRPPAAPAGARIMPRNIPRPQLRSVPAGAK